MKARQPQALTTLSLQTKHRMHVPCDDVVRGMRHGGVAQRHCAEQIRLGGQFNVKRLGWIARVVIVVAANQYASHIAMTLSPGMQGGERGGRVGFWCMQKIPQKK